MSDLHVRDEGNDGNGAQRLLRFQVFNRLHRVEGIDFQIDDHQQRRRRGKLFELLARTYALKGPPGGAGGGVDLHGEEHIVNDEADLFRLHELTFYRSTDSLLRL